MPRTATVDRHLVEAARSGDHDAYAALVLGVGDHMFRVAKLILRDADQAEDAVQDALVRAWHELPRLRDPERFDAWVRRLVVNACYDAARRQRRRVEISIFPDIEAPDRTSELVARDTLDRAFRRLAVDQRAVLVLHHYLGLTSEEVAEAAGIPVGTAKSRIHYATRAMRAALEADDRTTPERDRSRPA
jgi:RNA polymerase sigma-70 factor (ECF subfamily)